MSASQPRLPSQDAARTKTSEQPEPPAPPRPPLNSFVFLIAVQLLVGSGWLAEAALSYLREPNQPAYFRGAAGAGLMLAALCLPTRHYWALGLVATLNAFAALFLFSVLFWPQTVVDGPPARSLLFWPIFLLSIPGVMLSISQAVMLYRQKEELDAWLVRHGPTDADGKPLDTDAESITAEDENAAFGDTIDWDQAAPPRLDEAADAADRHDDLR